MLWNWLDLICLQSSCVVSFYKHFSTDNLLCPEHISRVFVGSPLGFESHSSKRYDKEKDPGDKEMDPMNINMIGEFC